MIAPLRKRHLLMWCAIAIIMPASVIMAYILTPSFPIGTFNTFNTAFPELLRSVVSTNYMFNTKKNYTGSTILEIVKISKINPASELVSVEYSKNPGVRTRMILGMLGSGKIYQFYLKDIQPPFKVEVIDTVKKMKLAEVEL